MLTAGTRFVPLCKSIRGDRVSPGALLMRVLFLIDRLPVMSMREPSRPSVKSWQLSSVRLVFSDILPEMTATFVTSVAAIKHSVAKTLALTANESWAMLRAEKIVCEIILQLLISRFVSYTRPVTVKPASVTFWMPMVASEDAELANMLPVISTGAGELDGPIRYILSLRVNPPSYVPGATKIQTGVVATRILVI
jgi:hypothetical protein